MLPFFITAPLLVCKVAFYSSAYTRPGKAGKNVHDLRPFEGQSGEPLAEPGPAGTLCVGMGKQAETGRKEFLRMPAPMQREMLFPPKPFILLASKEPGYLYALTRIKEMSRPSRLPRRPAVLRSYWICLLAKCQLCLLGPDDRLQALSPRAIILVITSDKPL